MKIRPRFLAVLIALLAVWSVSPSAFAADVTWSSVSTSWGPSGFGFSGSLTAMCKEHIAPSSEAVVLGWNGDRVSWQCTYPGMEFTASADGSCSVGAVLDQAARDCVAPPPPPPSSTIPLSSEDIAAVRSVGFSLVVFCFLIGRVVSVVIEFIREG